MVKVDQLTKSFGNSKALDEVTLEIDSGEVFALLGPNGAGKTTLIRLLLGLISPTSGHAQVFGLDSWSQSVEIHKRVGWVPAEPALWPRLTGSETLTLLGNLHGSCDEPYRDQLIDRLGLDADRKVGDLSTGNRQKVALIAAFMTRPDLLVLDEPTGGLDPLRKVVFRELMNEARANGQAILLSSHMLGEVEGEADRVGLLRQAKLVRTGTLEELRVAAGPSAAGQPHGDHERSLEELFLSLYSDND
ncbi:MAG: ATP-binding cassette domain-containing protein [Actinobacteria bacterium]|nr:ATP-binding cassette domain-containing protein [Actinomycetota bacterium]